MIIQILGPWFCNKPFVLHSLDFQLHQFVSIPPDLHSKSMPIYIYIYDYLCHIYAFIQNRCRSKDISIADTVSYHLHDLNIPMAFSQSDSGWAPNAIIAGHGNSAIVHAWSEWSYLPCWMILTLEVQPTIKIIVPNFGWLKLSTQKLVFNQSKNKDALSFLWSKNTHLPKRLLVCTTFSPVTFSGCIATVYRTMCLIYALEVIVLQIWTTNHGNFCPFVALNYLMSATHKSL